MDILSPEVVLLLVGVAAMAGFVDAIAGGGGLLTLPILLWAGLPPLQALATNKLQGSFGTFSASWHFIRRGHLQLSHLWPAIICTFAGSALGTLCVQVLDAGLLTRLMPVLLIIIALYFLFAPDLDNRQAKQRIGFGLFAFSIGTGVGFYDGFFGPGTGTFFAAAFVLLLGMDLRQATAGTKLLNLTSNLAALLFFALGGQVVWGLGLAMGIAQAAGAWLGAHMAIRHGGRLIRPLLVVVTVAISAKLLLMG